MTEENGSPQDEGSDRERHVTVNQVVAWNLAWYRRMAGLTQGQLAELAGWTKSAISDAERSVSGKWTREFDAHALFTFAVALGVPVGAFFLPPADDGDPDVYYTVVRAGGEDVRLEMEDLLAAVLPESGSETAAMDAYRDRLRTATGRYLDPYWHGQVTRLLEENGLPEMRDDFAARLDRLREHALTQADEWGRMAAAVRKGGEG